METLDLRAGDLQCNNKTNRRLSSFVLKSSHKNLRLENATMEIRMLSFDVVCSYTET